MQDQETARRKLNLTVPTINVTPLIDVLLVLLIIFMVIQPRREAKFATQIPQKPTVDYPSPADLLVVDVKGGSGPEQAIELNSKSMSLAELGVALKAILEQRGDKTVFVKAPRGKAYREIVYVIDMLKGVGAGPIGLQIDFLS